MNAERAAQQIVEAARHGDAELIVSLPAKLVVNGVRPGAGLHRPCDGSHQCAIATPPTTPATRAHRLAERLCRGALAALEANGEGGRAKQRVAGFSVNNDPSDCRSDARLSAVSAATISLSLK